MKRVTEVKRMTGLALVAVAAVILSVGCKKECKLEPKEGYRIVGEGKDCEYEAIAATGDTINLGDGSDSYEIRSNMTLKSANTYNLKGFVYVVDGATLTIEAGTVIKGDKATKATLIIERRGKIIAQGTNEKPIVFTSAQAAGSRNPGDWGGVIILGKAPNNQGEQTIEGGVRSNHGGSDPNDNSGVLSYVRIEFAGVEYGPDNEINGLTLGSVGAGTQIDHVQISHSGDDSFEWFGGTVNAKYLVAYRGWDDDFDTDNGFSGKIQFAVALRDPLTGDKSASNCFESDNNANGATTTPLTSAVFANVSLFGAVANPSAYTNQAGVNGSSVDARFQAGAHLRRHTSLSVFNSLIAAFPIGLIIENNGRGDAQGNATAGNLNVTNCVIAGCVKNYQDKQVWAGGSQFDETAGSDAFVSTYFTRTGGNNRTFTTLAELKLGSNPLNLNASGFFPQSDSPLATGAEWTNAKVSSWFQQVNYVGAFSPSETASSNWMTGWTNFDPQNTKY
jgi:hypothetical protein